MDNAEGRAERFWDIYREAVGGTAMKGEPLPAWADLNDKAKTGWLAVAEHTLSAA